jgi:hypothetical protein
MHELFPFAGGLLLGVCLGALRPSLRPLLGAAAAVAIGALATIASGEFRLSWAYLAYDIPLVASCAWLGLMASSHARSRRSGPLRP